MGNETFYWEGIIKLPVIEPLFVLQIREPYPISLWRLWKTDLMLANGLEHKTSRKSVRSKSVASGRR